MNPVVVVVVVLCVLLIILIVVLLAYIFTPTPNKTFKLKLKTPNNKRYLDKQLQSIKYIKITVKLGRKSRIDELEPMLSADVENVLFVNKFKLTELNKLTIGELKPFLLNNDPTLTNLSEHFYAQWEKKIRDLDCLLLSIEVKDLQQSVVHQKTRKFK